MQMQDSPPAEIPKPSNWEPKLLIMAMGLFAAAIVVANVLIVPQFGDFYAPTDQERYWFLSQSFTYGICETLVVALIFFTAVLGFEQLRAGSAGADPILGLALVWAGTTDVIHMVLTDQILADVPRGIWERQVDVISWVWMICRSFSGIILIFGVVLVLKHKHAIASKLDMALIFIISPLLFALAYYLAYWGGTSMWLPQGALPAEIITRPWDLVPMIVYVMAAVLIFPVLYLRRRTNFTLALWLSMIPNAGAHMYMAFMSTEPFDVHFYIALLLRVVAYATAFTGMLLDHSRTYVELRVAHEDMLRAVLERDKAEENQAELEIQYTGLIESMPLAVFHKDLEGRFTFVNDRTCNMIGMEEVQILGKTDTDFFPSDLAEKYRADDENVASTGQTFEDVERFRDGDGDERWVHVMKTPLYNPAGRAIGVRGLFWDITERVRAQEIVNEERQLRSVAEESQANTIAMYYSLIESLPLGVFCKDRDGRFTYVNDRICKMLMRESDELIGKTIADVMPAEVAERYAAVDAKVIETREVHDLVEPHHGSEEGGGKVHYVIAPEMDKSGRITGVRGFFWDVTDLMDSSFDADGVDDMQQALLDERTKREQAEQASRSYEALYSSLVESLPLAMFRKDQQGRYTFANKRWCDAKNTTLGEVIGKTDFDFHPKDRADKYRQDDMRVIETRETFEAIEENTDAKGNNIHTHVLKSPIYDADGEVIGVQGMWWDVTKQVEAEKAAHRIDTLYRSLLDSLPVAIFRKDLDGKYTFANKRWCDAKHMAEGEVIGKTDFDIHPDENAQAFRDGDLRVIETGEVFEATEPNSDADGNQFRTHVLKTPIYDESGKCVGVQGMWWKMADTTSPDSAVLEHEADDTPQSDS